MVAAIKRVRSTSGMRDGEYDMREVMSSFVAKLSFREMCVVLKEQKSWRQVRDFFAWMKLQVVFSLFYCQFDNLNFYSGCNGRIN